MVIPRKSGRAIQRPCVANTMGSCFSEKACSHERQGAHAAVHCVPKSDGRIRNCICAARVQPRSADHKRRETKNAAVTLFFFELREIRIANFVFAGDVQKVSFLGDWNLFSTI